MVALVCERLGGDSIQPGPTATIRRVRYRVLTASPPMRCSKHGYPQINGFASLFVEVLTAISGTLV